MYSIFMITEAHTDNRDLWGAYGYKLGSAVQIMKPNVPGFVPMSEAEAKVEAEALWQSLKQGYMESDEPNELQVLKQETSALRRSDDLISADLTSLMEVLIVKGLI